jgi:hypothetical protein
VIADNITSFLSEYLALESADQERMFPTKTYDAPESSGPNTAQVPNLPQPAARGVDHEYSNACFTILQAIIDVQTGNFQTYNPDLNTNYSFGSPDYYETYVQENVLKPVGINSILFSSVPSNATTDPALQGDYNQIGALWYSYKYDQQLGTRNRQNWMVGAAGWVTNAKKMGLFMNGLRGNAVLNDQQKDLMFTNGLGWYPQNGKFGTYYSHNGGFGGGTTADRPKQGIMSAFIHLIDGYDCALVWNSAMDETFGNYDAANLVYPAFDTRVVRFEKKP